MKHREKNPAKLSSNTVKLAANISNPLD